MVDEVTRETRIGDLNASVRLVNSLRNLRPWPLSKDLTVGEVLDIPDRELLHTPNFGKVSLVEWKRLTAHLRDEYTDAEEEQSEELRTLKKLRATLNTISGAHKQLANLYGELADIVLPIERR